MNFLSTALSLFLSLAFRDPRSCFVAGQTCGKDNACGNCKKTNCPDPRESKRCKRNHCTLEELAAFFPGDLMESDDKPLTLPELIHKVQKDSEVKQLRGGVTAEEKGRSPSFGALGLASLARNTYGVVGIVGANQAIITGSLAYDETGSTYVATGTANFPNPSDPTSRFVLPAQFHGTVNELDAQGHGVQTLTLEFPTAGIASDLPASLEVTEVTWTRFGPRAETMRAAFKNPEAATPGANVGALLPMTLTRVLNLTRRRARGYTDSSLRGLYAITCNTGMNTGFISGKLVSDGTGSLSGTVTVNQPDPEDTNIRKIVDTDVTGSYEVEDNGFATVSLVFNVTGFESGPSPYIVTTNRGSEEGPIISGMTGGFVAVSPVDGGLLTCELNFLRGLM